LFPNLSNTKKIVVRCRAIILHDGKLLVVGHPHDPSFIALPGGHLEWGEGVRECMRREIIEELGVKPEIGRLLYINNFTDSDNTQSVEFFFEVVNGADYIDCEKLARSHSAEIAKMIWAGPNDGINILPKKVNDDFKAGKLILDEVRFITSLK